MPVRRLAARSALAFVLSASAVASIAFAPVQAQAATEIVATVNREPVTSYQVRLRAAFLKLRREQGNLNAKAKEEMINETLKRQEIKRRGITIPDAMVDEAFGRFAKDNKLTEAQLGQVLAGAGFSTQGFKDYIRVQMGWGQAVQANMRRSEKMSEQDVVQRMLAQGGKKPTTTEYRLQQVIFVIPEAKRAAMGSARMKEANGLRSRFRSCEATYDTAKSLRDVTVRDLGRVAQPQLPPRWKDAIIETSVGKTTPPQATERGVEFIAVCDSRNVSDDVAAAMVFQANDMAKLGAEPDQALLKELREKAQIVNR
ncbi:peptidylprolyl isomerase [Aurantimonas sp. Leaf443]|uniref:peptidylprolyl isomerase n=1 Tax=Aurantimonas sp. Leaf443 TaxID=1736378 RepID=UPI0006F8472B|nr:peptidylprolyl isomerase [Aurantimonas sp. Leaf443]KQT88401.1 molecular chaperone SurA [Aurantimonas sp. Leaf443]